MATVIREVRYRCSNDCQPWGCPGHVAELCYQSTADHYSFALPDRQIAFERGELEAVLKLLSSLNRHDAVEVPAPLQPGENVSEGMRDLVAQLKRGYSLSLADAERIEAALDKLSKENG